jgi:hypothetical protein
MSASALADSVEEIWYVVSVSARMEKLKVGDVWPQRRAFYRGWDRLLKAVSEAVSQCGHDLHLKKNIHMYSFCVESSE